MGWWPGWVHGAGDWNSLETGPDGETKRVAKPLFRKWEAVALAKNAFPFVEENPLEVHFKRLGVGRLGQCLLLGNDALFDQLEEGLIEILHSILNPGLNGRRELIQSILLNELSDGRGVDHNLDGWNHTRFDPADHSLADHRFERSGQLAANLVPFFGLEKIKNSGDGLGGVRRVKR